MRNRSASNNGVPVTWLGSWNPIGERRKPTSPPGGGSLSQLNSPFSTFTSQINGIKKPDVMASTKGGQRLTVSCSRNSTALNACAGIALNQSGSPDTAGPGGTGGGSSPSNSFGQRNVSVFFGSSCSDIVPANLHCSFAWGVATLSSAKR